MVGDRAAAVRSSTSKPPAYLVDHDMNLELQVEALRANARKAAQALLSE